MGDRLPRLLARSADRDEVIARAELVVVSDTCGRTTPTTAYGEAPLLLRVTDHGRSGDDVGTLIVHMVGGAAGPLGGDELTTSVVVGAGARLRIRSVAAALAQPSAAGTASFADVTATVAASAMLDWHPQPLISVAGSDHTQRTVIEVADLSAQVSWIDEIVLGRHGEISGRLRLEQRLTVSGAPVLHHTVTFDPELAVIGRHGRARSVITAVIGGCGSTSFSDDAAARVGPSVRVARFALGETYTMLIALADDLEEARLALVELGCGQLSQRSGGMVRNHACDNSSVDTSRSPIEGSADG